MGINIFYYDISFAIYEFNNERLKEYIIIYIYIYIYILYIVIYCIILAGNVTR